MTTACTANTTRLLTAALAYAGREWKVFPCHTIGDGKCSCGKADCGSPGKHPRTPRGSKDATSDPAAIRAWWATWPDASIALATGAGSGIAVLDVDGPTGLASLEALRSRNGDGEQWTSPVAARTGGGGLPLFFRHREGLRNSAGIIGPGLDVRGEGGYVVAPPSRHQSGRRYRWLGPDGKPINEPPEIELPPFPPLPEAVKKRSRLDRFAIPEGERNDSLTRLAGRLRAGGKNEDEIAARLLAVNSKNCNPPLDENEVEGVARSAGGWAQGFSPGGSEEGLAEDARAAAAFIDAYSGVVRYCPDLRQWLVWDQQRWSKDGVGQALHLFHVLAKARFKAAGDIEDADARSREVKFWHARMRAKTAENALLIARTDPRVIVRLAELDQDPWLLNCPNGTIDLKTGELREHRQSDLITMMAASTYTPGAKKNLWVRFLRRVVPDRESRLFLKRAAGYSLSGDASEEKVFFISGPAASGKSTFAAAVREALGDYAVTVNFETFLARREVGGPRSDLARLANKRFAASVEVEDGSKLAGGLVKWVSGGDRLTVRGLYQSEVEFLPAFKVWLLANYRPKASDDDSALWRRLLLVPFDESIPEAERDPSIKRRLSNPRTEGEAVLAWAVEGCLAWQKKGLGVPSEVRRATAAWRTENDPLSDWLEQRCVTGDGCQERFRFLYENYKSWCEGNGVKAISGTAMGLRLKTRGFAVSGRAWIYTGIALKATPRKARGE